MNRREFLLLAQAIGLSAWYGHMVYAQTGQIRTRRSVTSKAAAADIATLKKGVGAMKASLTSTDYANWMYWANSHGTPDPIPPAMTNVWFKCQHGTPHFLSWHRAYVFFFESLIRDLTQSDQFALPYWDWYGSAAIPAVFADQAVGGTSNELFHKQRAYFRRTLLAGALQEPNFGSFQFMLEGNPHGTVHVMVGGEMGSVSTSARDPVFWAHHTNIDRMWSVWLTLDNQRKNPSDSSWLNTSFAFDVQGKKKLTGAQLVNTEALGYKYDSVAMTGLVDPIPLRPAKAMVISPSPGPEIKGMRTLSEHKGLVLTGSSINLDIRVPPGESKRMSLMSAAAKGERLSLVLEGVKSTELGLKRGFEYRVYANLPTAASGKHRHGDFFLGVINSFQLGHHASQTLSFSISKLAPAQAKHGLWSTDAVSVSLISDDKETTQPLVTVDSVRLVAAKEPVK